ncbi:MAG: YibE/F family protein [Defluviitaleaceae bacterium]|nr:YibE/F family protein [Defluviitaleaceae bacterium]
MKINETACFFIVVILSIIFLFVGSRFAAHEQPQADDMFMSSYYTGVVTEIIHHEIEEWEMGVGFWETVTQIHFNARITRGERRGETIIASQFLDTHHLSNDPEVEVGNRIILFYDDFAERFYFANFVRINAIAVLGVVFLALVILFARKKGFNAIVALGFTCLAIFMVFIPAILAGRNVYVTTLVICIYAIVSTLLLVIGPNKKSLAAMLGCLGGILTAGVLMVFMDNVLRLTGVMDSETQFLMFMLSDNPIDLRAIIFASVILGAVGAIMDVAMSIASSLWELRLTGGVSDFKSIIKSGFSIGKDILGTMLNTLILAYIGSSLSLLLLIFATATSMTDLLNMEMIVVEFLRALVGSFGMLLAIPLTAAVCAWLYSSIEEDEEERNDSSVDKHVLP